MSCLLTAGDYKASLQQAYRSSLNQWNRLERIRNAGEHVAEPHSPPVLI
jgi:hypothetical protein